MIIKFSNGTEVEAKEIEYYNNNKIKNITFEKRVTLKTKLGNITFNKIGLNIDNKLNYGVLGDYLVLKSDYNTEIVCEPLDTIETYRTLEINRILFDGVKTIKTFYGPIDIISPIRIYPTKVPRKILLYKQKTIKTKFGNITLNDSVAFNFDGTLRYYQSVNPFIVKINNKEYEVYSILNKYPYSEIKLELVESKVFNTTVGDLILTQIALNNDNKIISGELYEPQSINTKYGKLLIRNNISFKDNGNIDTLELDDLTYVKLSIGSQYIIGTVHFNNAGNIESCFLYNMTTVKTKVGTIIIEHGESAILRFHKNGKLKVCYLSDKTTIDTPLGLLECKDLIKFDEAGNLTLCHLAEPTEIQTNQGNITISELIYFNEDSAKTTLNKTIRFNKDLTNVTASDKITTNEHTINQIEYSAHSTINIDRKGNII